MAHLETHCRELIERETDVNNETVITQTRVDRLTRFLIEASSSSEIDLTDELALDRAYDEAIQQISVFAKSNAALPDLVAMEIWSAKLVICSARLPEKTWNTPGTAH
ncbi:hypothetical protein ELH02_14160 [Rhizobium ruizarguesonis]|uniref:hypothetical protein n=1 Tax=Rhizobium ruizarguesonis TaxID=2081791 RepID=UPI001031DA38|nr:hypothetical protein [Rhizobium ruizarguesonis]TBE45434.1 hypothetical protein ELH02_14160 [Rhizobium ruizarguesonis]